MKSAAGVQSTVMIISSVPENIHDLESMLSNCCCILPFANGEEALASAECSPPDLLLIDVSMPDMDRYQLCERFKAIPQLNAIPVLFISCSDDAPDKARAFSLGAVDCITAPFISDEVRARVTAHLKIRRQQQELEAYSRDLEERVQLQVQEISRAQTATIAALAKLAESRDDGSTMHIQRIQNYCRTLATRLAESSPYSDEVSQSFIEALYHAAPLHDIGKIAIPDAILLKPGKLTAEEFEVTKRHTIHGARNLVAIHAKFPHNTFIRAALNIARSHHERWDGTGYPDGSRGEETPLYARIVALADSYDALRTTTCYHTALSHRDACAAISVEAGSKFDPHIVAAFKDISDEFEQISNERGDDDGYRR